MSQNKRYILPGIILSAVLFVISGLFVAFLVYTRLLPIKYILLISALLLMVCGGVLLLTRRTNKKVKFIIGCVLTVVSVAGMVLVFLVLNRLTSTLKAITHDGSETVQLSVYVKADDKAQNLDDAAGYTFCILKEIDRDSTDLTVEKINSELGISVKTAEYDTLVDALNAIIEGENCALIINPDFLDALSEIEEYEEILSKLREIAVKHIEVTVPDTSDTNNSTSGGNKKPSNNNGNYKDGVDSWLGGATATNKPDGVFQIYISGIDRYGSIKYRSRSDVNIIATVNTNTHEILLVTTPRDYYVPMPNSKGKPDKLTHAGIYGVNNSIGTLEMLYDIDIDYYFRLNFSGFSDIINAIGGVDIYSPKKYDLPYLKLQKGYNHVNGGQALNFARCRKPYGEAERAKNQMEIIKAVIRKLTTSTAILENFPGLMNSVEGCFQTTMPYDGVTELVRDQLDTMPEWHVTTYSVSGTGARRVPYSLSTRAYVVLPNYDTVEVAKQKMQAVMNGEILK